MVDEDEVKSYQICCLASLRLKYTVKKTKYPRPNSETYQRL